MLEPLRTGSEAAPTAGLRERIVQRLAPHRPRAERWLKTAPVWVPLLFAVHIALLGLLPAFLESRRLSAEERALGARLDAATERGQQLERLRRAQQDPVYLERELRAARFGTGAANDPSPAAAPAPVEPR